MLEKLLLAVVQKAAEATRDVTGNKIADKITSVGKTKSNEKEEIYTPPEKKTANYWRLKIILNIV